MEDKSRTTESRTRMPYNTPKTTPIDVGNLCGGRAAQRLCRPLTSRYDAGRRGPRAEVERGEKC
jgi:hypothetical protein